MENEILGSEGKFEANLDLAEVVLIFLELVHMESQSKHGVDERPTSEGQTDVLDHIQAVMDHYGFETERCEKGTVIAVIPASEGFENLRPIGWAAHVDTSPDASGQVNPLLWHYHGGDLELPNGDVVISPQTEAKEDDRSPTLARIQDGKYLSNLVITSDGSSLLGADDKAGVAAMMAMARNIWKHKSLLRRRTILFFCPDEEVGLFGEDLPAELMESLAAFITPDGTTFGTLDTASMRICRRIIKANHEPKEGLPYEYEITFKGQSGHPGVTPGAWKPALAMAADAVICLTGWTGFSLFDGSAGSARLVVTDSNGDAVVPNILKSVATRHPGVTYEISEPVEKEGAVHYPHIMPIAWIIHLIHNAFPVTTFRGNKGLGYIIPGQCLWDDGKITLQIGTANSDMDESEEFNDLADNFIRTILAHKKDCFQSIEVKNVVLCESVATAIAANPEIMGPLRQAFEKMGLEFEERTVAGGTDGGMLNRRFPDLPAPNVGTGAEQLHDVMEHIAVDDLLNLADWMEAVSGLFAEMGD